MSRISYIISNQIVSTCKSIDSLSSSDGKEKELVSDEFINEIMDSVDTELSHNMIENTIDFFKMILRKHKTKGG